MSSTSLPGELIEAIIDEVGLSHDRPTLKACSLVSLAFVFPSQKHLFHEIDLEKPDPRISRKTCYQRFHKLLLAKPHLGIHIRELRIGDDSEDDFGWGSGKSWIVQTKSTLSRTLSLLPKLEAFSLSFSADMVSWKSIPAETRAAIGSLFRLPSLKAASLEFITSFPPQLLLSLLRLQYLSLSCVEVDTGTLITSDMSYLQGRWETNLRSVFLRGVSPPTITSIADVLSESSPHTLKKITATPSFESGFGDAIGELLRSSGSNLTTFEWSPSIHFQSSIGSINLTCLPLLHTLRFDVSFRRNNQHGPFRDMLRLLDQLSESSPSQIHNIVVDCHCITRVDPNKMKLEWGPLDKMLTKPVFIGLKEVKIRLSTNTSTGVERQKFILAFQDLFPLLQGRGVATSAHNFEEVEKRTLLKEMEVL